MSIIASRAGSNTNLTGTTDRLLQVVNDGVEKWWVDVNGFSSDDGRINVMAFGAKGDGITDDHDAIQAALDSVAAGDSVEFTKSTVYMPPGKYFVSKPLKIQKTYTKFMGAGMTSSYISVTNGLETVEWQGPTLFVVNEDHPIPGQRTGLALDTSLVTGPGSSMRVDTTQSLPVYLAPTNDIPAALDFNYYSNPSIIGPTDLTVEFFLKIDPADVTSPGNPAMIMSSLGVVPGEFTTSLFALNLNKDLGGNYAFSMAYEYDTGSANAGTAFSYTTGVVYHIAMVSAPTLGTLTLYVDGVQAAQVAVPIGSHGVQHPFETIQFGDRGSIFYPDGDTSTVSSIMGWFDSIRISCVARYTAPFSPPTSKFVWASQDHDTRFLLNFDRFYGEMPIAQGWQYGPYGVPFDYYLRVRGAVVNNPVGWVEIREMTVQNSSARAIVVQSSTHGKVEDVRIQGGMCGLEFNENSYILDVNRVSWEGGVGNYAWNPKSVSGREGILSRGAVGFARMANLYLAGGVVATSLIRPGTIMENVDILGQDHLIYGLIAEHADEFDSLTLKAWGIDLETATGAALRAAVYLNGVRSAHFIDSLPTANPPDAHPCKSVIVYGTVLTGSNPPDQLTMSNCSFLPGTGNTIFDIRAGTPSIVLENCKVLYGISHTLSNHPEFITTIGGADGFVWNSQKADGSSSVAHTLNTAASYTTSGGKLLSIQNGGTETDSIGYNGALTVGPLTVASSPEEPTLIVRGQGGIAYPVLGFVHGGSGVFGFTYTGNNYIVLNRPGIGGTMNIVPGDAAGVNGQIQGFGNATNGIALASHNGTTWVDNVIALGGQSILQASAPDGASAVAATINTTTAWTTAGAVLLSIQNNSAEQVQITKDGFIIPTVGNQLADLGSSSLNWSQLFCDTTIQNLVQSLFDSTNRLDIQTANTLVQVGTGGVINLSPKAASTGTAVAVTIENLVTLNTAGDKLLSIKNNGSERAYIDHSGLLRLTDSVNFDVYLGGASGLNNALWLASAPPTVSNYAAVGFSGNTYLNAPSGFLFFMQNNTEKGSVGTKGFYGPALFPIQLNGRQADGASAIGAVIETGSAFTTAGAKIASFTNNNVEKLAVDKDGMMSVTQGSVINGGTSNTASGRLTITSGSSATFNNSLAATGVGILTTVEQLGGGGVDFVKTAVCTGGSITITMDANTTSGSTIVYWFLVGAV
jgi:hypothetical protein